MRRVKVVSDSPIDAGSLPVVTPAGTSMNTWSDDLLGLHYLEASWPCREAISIRCEGWPCAREMVLWKLAPGERVSEVLTKMEGLFGERFRTFPDYAFMRRLPKTVDHGFEVDDVTFCEA